MPLYIHFGPSIRCLFHNKTDTLCLSYRKIECRWTHTPKHTRDLTKRTQHIYHNQTKSPSFIGPTANVSTRKCIWSTGSGREAVDVCAHAYLSAPHLRSLKRWSKFRWAMRWESIKYMVNRLFWFIELIVNEFSNLYIVIYIHINYSIVVCR